MKENVHSLAADRTLTDATSCLKFDFDVDMAIIRAPSPKKLITTPMPYKYQQVFKPGRKKREGDKWNILSGSSLIKRKQNLTREKVQLYNVLNQWCNERDRVLSRVVDKKCCDGMRDEKEAFDDHIKTLRVFRSFVAFFFLHIICFHLQSAESTLELNSAVKMYSIKWKNERKTM